MRFPHIALGCVASGCLVWLLGCRSPGSSPIPEARADEPRAHPGTFAVVELFTSEGCSSCPSADDVFADLAHEEGRGVLALAFHVDYWDGLGWPDRYASPQATARQREYARSFGTDGLYTPQMVVAGTEEFVGSNRERADAAIAHALARASGAKISVVPRRNGSDAVLVDYEVAGAPQGSRLTVAVVQQAASTQVRAGENAGRTLRHANVVRGFAVLPLGGARGTATVALRVPVARANGEVIAYVQQVRERAAGMPVIAATTAPLPE